MPNYNYSNPFSFNFFNPLINKTINNFPFEEKKTKFNLENYIKFLNENANKTIAELKKLKKKEYITVDDYLEISKRVTTTQTKKISSLIYPIIQNQDELLFQLIEFINIYLKMISDEQKMKEYLKNKDFFEKTYFPAVIKIQKTLLGELREELNKSKKNKLKYLAKIPFLNFAIFNIRTRNLQRFTRAIAATNILGIRATVLFDKDKIKKEISQAYEEFAEADILEPKHKFDEYNKYLGSALLK